LEIGDGAGVEHRGELFTVEIQPVKVTILAEDLVCAARTIINLSTPFIGEDSVGDGDFLEFLMGFFTDVFADLVYTLVISRSRYRLGQSN
jgi:hypothetical protein